MKPDWRVQGKTWPNREASSFVVAGGLRWHVQQMGEGPVLLLLHGAGAATHSWRDLAPLLARDFRVIAPDLPGHGFTDTPPAEGLSLPGMARSLTSLLQALGVKPFMAVGHSAGAALAIRLALGRTDRPWRRGQSQRSPGAVSRVRRRALSRHGPAPVPQSAGHRDVRLPRPPPRGRRAADREHRVVHRSGRAGAVRQPPAHQRSHRGGPGHDGQLEPAASGERPSVADGRP